ncbi:MAG: hypothetical protein ACRDGN_08990, partial [bacterium]
LESVGEMLDKVAQDAGGDYSKALSNLHLRGVSAEITQLYDEARRSPTAENWRRLRDVLIQDLEAVRGSLPPGTQ